MSITHSYYNYHGSLELDNHSNEKMTFFVINDFCVIYITDIFKP